MDEVIKAIVEILPFGELLHQAGISEEKSVAFATLINAVIAWGVIVLIDKLRKRLRNSIAERNLKPQFDYKSIKAATKNYIPTQYQNANPARQEEPKFSHQFVSRSRLIPFFIKTAFIEKRESERFYLILADSGMGKTTFMVNLYMKYTSFWNRYRGRNDKIKLFRLGDTETMDLVKEIKREDAVNTILLLDALDEDPFIIPKDNNLTDKAFRKRFDKIIKATRNFKDVVLTCRTQYFPGQEDDPYELKIKRPDDKGFYLLNKLYISPFDNDEVNIYLNKKYPWWQFWNLGRKQMALRIVKNSPKLVVRPMLLSYIDLLVDDEKPFKTVYSIYETFIEKWLLREAEKRKPLKERKGFIENLRKLSQQGALSIYHKRTENSGLFISKEQAISLAQENNIELKPDEVTGKSLLTSDGSGNWKFAHKSILEFFLANHCVNNLKDAIEFDFSNMDMVLQFVEEKLGFNMLNYVFVNESNFRVGAFGECRIKLSAFYISKYQVTKADYVKITGIEIPVKDIEQNPINGVSWNEAIEYCNILNKKSGYQPTYDKMGNLLDESGNVTIDISKVKGFRLPTAAEWGHAASWGGAGHWNEFAGTNIESRLKYYAWYEKNSKLSFHPVGQLKPNHLGLYDMSGNVWEWCIDWDDEEFYETYFKKGIVSNPINTKKSTHHLCRGGSIIQPADSCRTVWGSGWDQPHNHIDLIGFRLVFVP